MILVRRIFSGLLICLAILLPCGAADAPAQIPRGRSKAEAAKRSKEESVERQYQDLLLLSERVGQTLEELSERLEEARLKGDFRVMTELNERASLSYSNVCSAFKGFVRKHASHVPARIAFGNLLFENGDEQEAVVQWKKAIRLDPKNPDPWNNLAHYYQHRGPIREALIHYTKAIKLDRTNPIFLRNLAGTIFLFRKDAMEFYKITEPEVFDKAISIYRQALALDPKDFELAVELAESFYLIKPLRTSEALQAWNVALELAENSVQREAVWLHMARVEMNSGLFEAAQAHLNAVTNAVHNLVKAPLVRSLQQKQAQSAGSSGVK